MMLPLLQQSTERHRGHVHGFIVLINITHRFFVATEEIRPEGIFPDEGCLSQTFGCVSVTLAQPLFTRVLHIICNEEHTFIISDDFSLHVHVFTVSLTDVLTLLTDSRLLLVQTVRTWLVFWQLNRNTQRSCCECWEISEHKDATIQLELNTTHTGYRHPVPPISWSVLVRYLFTSAARSGCRCVSSLTVCYAGIRNLIYMCCHWWKTWKYNTTLGCFVITCPVIFVCFGLAAKTFSVSITAVVSVAAPTYKIKKIKCFVLKAAADISTADSVGKQ